MALSARVVLCGLSSCNERSAEEAERQPLPLRGIYGRPISSSCWGSSSHDDEHHDRHIDDKQDDDDEAEAERKYRSSSSSSNPLVDYCLHQISSDFERLVHESESQEAAGWIQDVLRLMVGDRRLLDQHHELAELPTNFGFTV